MTKIAVLMYHSIISSNDHPGLFSTEDPIYTIRAEMFEKQMKYLHEHNFPVFTLNDIYKLNKPGKLTQPNKPNQPNNPITVVITFDDGHITNYTKAFPILKNYGFKAHFFITTGWIGKPNYMSTEQIKELADYRMIIGSHGITHRFLSNLSEKEIIWELKESKEILEKITGEEIKSLALPGGRFNNKILKLAKEIGYKAVFTSNLEFNLINSNIFNLKRIAIKQNTPFEQFKDIINGKISKKYIIKSHLFNASKKLLGNNSYKRIRERILKNNL